MKEQEDKDESDFLRYDAVFYYFLAKTNVYNLFKILFCFFWFFTIKSTRGYFRNLFWAAVVVRVIFHWRYFCEYITQHCHVSVNTRSMGMVRSKFSYN